MQNAGSGDVDVYTVPSGRRASVVGFQGYNSAGTTTTVYGQIKVSATYYPISTQISINTVTGSNNLTSMSIIAEAGESLGIHTSQAGMNLFLRIIEWDNTELPKSPRLLTLATGDNTLYTCPANTRTTMLSSQFQANGPGIFIVNRTGTTRTYNLFIVPSGGASGTGNKFENAISVNDLSQGLVGIPCCLSAGDFVVINTDANTAGQTVYLNVMEIPV